MANSFLNYFFDEVENGIDAVMNKSPHVVQDTTARLMNVPSEEVASKATKLLKSEVKQVLNDEVNKMDENFLRKIFGVATAALVAVSAYAYIV